MPELLGADAIAARVAARSSDSPDSSSQGQGGGAAPSGAAPRDWHYVRTLGDGAVTNLVEALQNTDGRLMWGIRDLDLMMRGVGDGDLCMVTGRAHSGKTQIVMQMICNNPTGRFVLFTPDEMAELVLMKLAAIMRGLNPEDIERKIKAGDSEIVDVLREVATRTFPNLVVIDDPLSFDEMRNAVMEAEEFWNARCQGVFLDYIELVPGDADHDGVSWKVQEAKRFAKGTKVPCVFLHQAKRGDRGQAKGMDNMRYGGENEATYVVEVFRKCQDESLDAYEREAHAHTITVGVVKNKRPPCKTGYHDLFIDGDSGAIRPLAEGDLYVRDDKPLEDEYGPLVPRDEYHAQPVAPEGPRATPESIAGLF